MNRRAWGLSTGLGLVLFAAPGVVGASAQAPSCAKQFEKLDLLEINRQLSKMEAIVDVVQRYIDDSVPSDAAMEEIVHIVSPSWERGT